MIKINQTNPVVLHVSIREMYDCFVECMTDLIWDDVAILDHNRQFTDDLKSLSTENVEEIRTMFQQGQTCLLMGEKMDIVERSFFHDGDLYKTNPGIEIRLYNRTGSCVGVILNQHVNF
jgi:hypothetical protein